MRYMYLSSMQHVFSQLQYNRFTDCVSYTFFKTRVSLLLKTCVTVVIINICVTYFKTYTIDWFKTCVTYVFKTYVILDGKRVSNIISERVSQMFIKSMCYTSLSKHVSQMFIKSICYTSQNMWKRVLRKRVLRKRVIRKITENVCCETIYFWRVNLERKNRKRVLWKRVSHTFSTMRMCNTRL